jgi:hypothetical protein
LRIANKTVLDHVELVDQKCRVFNKFDSQRTIPNWLGVSEGGPGLTGDELALFSEPMSFVAGGSQRRLSDSDAELSQQPGKKRSPRNLAYVQDVIEREFPCIASMLARIALFSKYYIFLYYISFYWKM